MSMMKVAIICVFFFFYGFNLNASDILDEDITIDSIAYECAKSQYDLYVKGVNAQLANNIHKTKEYFEQYLNQDFKHKTLNDVEIDLLARYIDIAYAEEDWIKICNLGERLELIDQQTRKNYKNTAWMYFLYVYSLNMLNRCGQIDDIVQTGLYYVDCTYSPAEKEYYDLRFQYIMAKLNKDDVDSAIRILNEIKKINDLDGLHIVDNEIHQIEQFILKYRESSPMSDKDEFIETFSKYVVKTALITGTLGYSDAKECWDSLISSAQNFVENTYFDEYSVKDEKRWTKFLTYYSALINGLGRSFSIPNRGQIAYNYVLMSKNFLDWHSSKNNRNNIGWEQIFELINKDEIAIEFIPHCNEMLILSHDFDIPQIVEIDSAIINAISQYNNEDPLIINSFYKNSSPLCNLITALRTYLVGKTRIYISGSNYFAQFNYGAIPYGGKTLNDFFEVIPMISTADVIKYKKQQQKNNFKKISLYGGIDYNNVSPVLGLQSYDNVCEDLYDVPEKLRKGYDYLPYTKTEVDSIAALCKKFNVPCRKFCGKDASELNVKKYSDSSTILHIATHSFLLPSYSFNAVRRLSNENEISKLGTVLTRTGLLLSGCNESLKIGFAKGEDGILTAKEISNLNLNNVGLVVLSSCSSGFGDITNINGIVYGLTNAFRSAGCNQVMVSLWNVPDYTTSQFMVAFYENLLRGCNTRDSLKFAQSYMISLGYKDPYYWASFILLD